MVDIKRVTVTEHLASVRDLADSHWQETEAGFSSVAPELDLDMYQVMEQAGRLIAFAAFDGNRIVGYVSGFISRHPHYEMMVAQHDLLFVAPDYRKGRVGLKLIAAFEDAAKAEGAQTVFYHAKPDSQFSKLLGRLKFSPEEVVYRKDF